jgi:DNA-binding GntR family transcriptional regulator
VQRSFEEHQAILDAIREGDGDKAVAATRTHLVVQGERFADLLASLSQMDAGAPQASSTSAAA